ncbi:MAG: polysaccharide biosynthesis/export family protein [Desulfobulbus sp.]|nr:polysaccharide biosynthesis/export family protein [Desulfobulbus sp.]
MKNLFLVVKAIICFGLSLCMLAVSWAAESSGEGTVSNELKQKYRQEILGKQGSSPADKEYIIGYRDMLYLEVYGEGSMAIGPATPASAGSTMDATGTQAAQEGIRGRGTGSEVGMDGRVSLRHLGDVYVVGMTLSQLADYLKKLYSTIYDDPTIITTLLQSNSRQYTVMGQVKAPGLFHLDFPTTIVKAIAKAGGFTEWSNSEVTVIRQGNDLIVEKGKEAPKKKVEKFTFDYDDFLDGKLTDKNILLEPGDVVVVH